MDITYTKRGDFYYPDLVLPPQPTGDIGRFGRMRKKFLKGHQPDTFALMLMENSLTQHLIDIDRKANEQIDLITSQLAPAEGVTEDLKARDQLKRIRLDSLSVRTLIVYPHEQSIFFLAKNPVFASAYRPQLGHSITNLDIAFLPPHSSTSIIKD